MLHDQRWPGRFRVKSEKFDLVMLDLAMPEFSGYDVVRPLKQDGVLESSNIVVFTASSDVETLKEIGNSVVREVFKKPFSLDEITDLIKKYRPVR